MKVKINDLSNVPKSNYTVNINAIDLPLSNAQIKKGITRRYVSVKSILPDLESLKDPKMWQSAGAGGQDQYAGLPPAIRIIDGIIKKLQ